MESSTLEVARYDREMGSQIKKIVVPTGNMLS